MTSPSPASVPTEAIQRIVEEAEALAKRIARFLTDEAETQKAATSPREGGG